eukprot:CAMPEP_0168166608 /NCGR_PEP_ID=MMETSP0139_2-20121125/2116_1 /TAXON_ID=44445 /ORGANISM="Pseudo-nitzschia australis, Strain 10249 10 AB" /LENGTH=781 /DNA_ID=CAMNT_0008083813 /DNA_START=228 /DNA_END=2574 /DNA_ORIENTATION=-
MSDFACRVLSRHVTSSNVLVIAPGAVSFAMKAFEERNVTQQFYSDDSSITRQDSVGTGFLRYGVAEGHTIHAINDHHPEQRFGKENYVPTLDDWWTSFDGDKSSNNDLVKNATGSKLWWSTNPDEKPTWILLAVFDSEFGSAHSVWEKAESFLESCTVTYIVIAIHSVKLKDGSYRFGGIDAVESLLRRRYKLQTLSCSHYHAEHNNAREILDRYGPNALFQSVKQLKGFLRWGADVSHSYGESTDDYFTSYIFATQGLDLAIPTPQTYLQYGGRGIDAFDEHDMKRLPPLKSCPDAKSKNMNFDFDETSLRLNLAGNKSIEYSEEEIGEKSKEEFSFWMNGSTLSKSEAVCISNRTGLSKCKTRISDVDVSNDAISENRKSPNVLLLLLDPISRSHFDRVMPRTKTILQELNFLRFERYTSVGPNSGPNQAALYSGIKLGNRGDLHNNTDSGNKWLWDRLKAAGYVTLKGEDSCIENSNMMQSLAPNTTHGSALQGLFCFDAFSRPNCIGPDLASSILFDYGYQFISTYEKLRSSTHPDLRWASFMHFVDSHEDTMVLSASLDSGLSKFLKRIENEGYFENSVVILTSDHGLHYGPNFSSRQGRREATEPILYIHIPPFLRHSIDMNALTSNSRLWTTPFDLHETLLKFTQTSSKGTRGRRRGLTLTEHLPESRKDCRKNSDLIPPKFCDLQLNETIEKEDNTYGFCRAPRKRSVIDSFFLDIPPLKRRPLMNFDSDCHNKKQRLTDVNLFGLCDDTDEVNKIKYYSNHMSKVIPSHSKV